MYTSLFEILCPSPLSELLSLKTSSFQKFSVIKSNQNCVVLNNYFVFTATRKGLYILLHQLLTVAIMSSCKYTIRFQSLLS